MSRIRTGLVAAAALAAVPTAAVAAGVFVDHGHGPSNTYDAAYADISTQVHAWTRGDSTTRTSVTATGSPCPSQR